MENEAIIIVNGAKIKILRRLKESLLEYCKRCIDYFVDKVIELNCSVDAIITDYSNCRMYLEDLDKKVRIELNWN